MVLQFLQNDKIPSRKQIQSLLKKISEIINRGWTSKRELETNSGRWVHLGQIVPPVHHFFSRLRYLKQRAKNKLTIMVNEGCNKDQKFLLTVLQKCQHGINLNAIAYCHPTNVYRSGSCPAGLGGYGHKGFAWQYHLPKDLKFRASNNLLEQLAAIITPWVDILTGRHKEGNCALSMTNNTTLEGWLKKTNFIKDCEEPIQATIQLEVARHHATNYLLGGIQEYSQWFRGADNHDADALSQDDERSDNKLTNILRTHYYSQLPQHFKIVPLPVVGRLDMYRTKVLLYRTMVLSARPTKVRG
jgi:hypothetical protein